MGSNPKKFPIPKRLFRARRARRPPAPSFQAALQEVAIEDVRDRPCIICADPVAFLAQWQPSPEIIARELNGDPSRDRLLIYGLCSQCAERGTKEPEFVTTVEATILELWRGGNAIKFKDGALVS